MCIFNNQCAPDTSNSFWWIISCQRSILIEIVAFLRFVSEQAFPNHQCTLELLPALVFVRQSRKAIFRTLFCWQLFWRSCLFLPKLVQCLRYMVNWNYHHRGIGPFDTKRFWRDPYFLSQSVDNFLPICQFCWKSYYQLCAWMVLCENQVQTWKKIQIYFVSRLYTKTVLL